MTAKNLTDIQKQIIEAPLGSALVTAGAGSGKTRVLTHRLAWVIQKLGISDHEIAALTFTNKAAAEMKKRVSDLLGYECGAFLGTFHSFCARFLRKNISKLNANYNNDFSIYATSDTQKVIKEVLSNNSFNDLTKDSAKTVEWHISNMKNGGDTFGYSDEILRAIKAYDEKLSTNNALDFDDLLLKTLDVFEKCPEVLAQMQQRFKYILVDEFQDTNLIQYKIARYLAGEHKNIMVVGDEDQCIYTWRGASIKNIKLFEQDFENVETYKLEENFRSSKNIVELANHLVGHNSNRIKKTLFSSIPDGKISIGQCYNEKEEAQRVAEFIVSQVKGNKHQQTDETNKNKYSDFAILMRINALSRNFEEQFLAYNIPHIIWGGFKFYERAEIKSVINYLRLLVNNRDDVALFDIINWPRRGIGDASIEKIKSLGNPYEIVVDIDKHAEQFTKKTLGGIKSFVHTLKSLREINDSFGLFELGGSLISTIGLDSMFDKKKEEDLNRLENIYQLEKAIKDFACDNEGATLTQWLQSVSLVSGDDNASGDDAVIISTVHSAKGLEFKTVFIVGIEDGIFPLARSKNSEDEMEEERRLLYVAITRARERLYLSHCSARFLHGERKMCLPSVFLKQCGFEIAPTPEFRDSINATRSHFSNHHTSSTLLPAKDDAIKAKKDTVESLGYTVGDRVSHEKFGQGTVSQIIDKNIIKIQFDIAGVKMLSLAFATIKKL